MSNARVKTEGYSHAIADAKKERKRNEANARDAVYSRLSLAVKLQAIKTRRGKSNREFARLTKGMAPV